MTRHKKHDDILDVQIRTKILDQYGNPIEGAIEYDPATGYGKRIKDPTLGLVEDFYCKDGSIEIEGHNFDDTNHDEDEVDSIREMITLKVSRNDPNYQQMLQTKVNQKRDEKTAKQKEKAVNITTSLESGHIEEITRFIAKTQIASGEEVTVDLTTGEVRGTRSDNVHRPDERTRR